MTSKIKVDNVNKVSDDSNIINKCGTTITLGASGDTINLAAGASQSGFGRTGTVDWQTGDIKTSAFTPANGKGYFVNTTAGAVTVNLAASPTVGDIFAISDYANTFSTYNVTLNRNGNLINGGAFDYTSGTDGVVFTLIYVDGVRGWKLVDDGTLDITGQSSYIIASVSGACNTLTTAPDCANYKIATFVNPGTFTICQAGTPAGSDTVDYMVIGGGGSGGGGAAGGGGAGGFRESVPSPAAWTASPIANPGNAQTVTVQGYPIVVGGGGAASPGEGPGNNGNPGDLSSGLGISSSGGGYGAGGCVPSPTADGGPGGSGGGGGYPSGPQPPRSGGTGNVPVVSPAQGKDGGDSRSTLYAGGGGGGAICAGQNGQPGASGAGGAGASTSISGSSVQRAGGGGGSSYPGSGSPTGGGAAGAGGGGEGMPGTGPNINGSANTGGGGGGGAPGGPGTPGAGGSGIVILRYKFQ